MITLIKNEMIKLMSRKKTLVVTAAFAVLIVLLIFGIYRDNKANKFYNSPKQRLASLNNELNYYKSEKKNQKSDSKNLADINQGIKDVQNQIAQVKYEMNKKVNWKDKLENDIKNAKSQLSQGKMDESTRSDIQANLDKLKYLQKHEIKPENEFDLNAVGIMQRIISTLGLIFLPIGLVMFSSDMVSGEYTPPTMKVLLTQPISRGKVLASKFIAVTLVSILLVVGIELIYFVATGIIFGFGNMNYPMMAGGQYHYDKEILMKYGTKTLALIAGTSHAVPAWKYIVELFALNIVFIVCASAFCFLISTVMKSSMVSMATGSIFVIAVLVLSQAIESIHKITQFVFLSYGDVDSLLTGGISVSIKNPNVNLQFALGVMILWGIISYAISHMVFTKKDLLI